LLQQSKQQAQQQMAQEQMKDPIVQMQMQELQIKQAEQQRKAQKDKDDAQLKMAQIQVERDRIAAQQEIAGANMAMKHQQEVQRAEKAQETEGFRQGIAMLNARQKTPPKR
jgi:hypothetical protein